MKQSKYLFLLPHGNFAIELERVKRLFEIHGAIAPFARIKKTPLSKFIMFIMLFI